MTTTPAARRYERRLGSYHGPTSNRGEKCSETRSRCCMIDWLWLKECNVGVTADNIE